MSRDSIDQHEAMLLHCFIAYVKQFGDVYLPYNAETKRLAADNRVQITPQFDATGEVEGFSVALVTAPTEPRESLCGCLGIPHREDCLLGAA